MRTINDTRERVETIEAMNNLIIYEGSDESFDKWLEFMPDGLKDDVFLEIAKDDIMLKKLCDLFCTLMKRESEVEAC